MIVVGASIVVVTLSGLVAPRHPNPPPPVATPAPATAAQPPPPATGTPPSGPDVGLLTADFARLQSAIDGRIGLMIAPAGIAASPVTLGEWTIGPAWSTIKVPLVIAALREDHSAEITDAMRAAIVNSDNAAAESIWEGLGDPATAAHTVERVLVEADDHTTVESRRIRPQFTAFGQTLWSLTAQVRFAAFAACDERDAPVRALMGQIEPDQRWGLGDIPNAEFKGGWGPSEEGRYLVRQFGFLTHASGAVSVVAMAVEPASGSFSDGTADITKIGDWLNKRIAMLPAGQCHGQAAVNG
ncbi:hypothetical protein [Mycobacterium sp. E3198]|uniref:hypothetical protein n=1 Tax=Mycobacterium sp. E3198 TaxID=1834143 RepID=UPI000A5222D3|nr:hypothetical protein [Mycobacterium sp. E3198]